MNFFALQVHAALKDIVLRVVEFYSNSHFRHRKIYMTFHSKSCIRSIRVSEKHRKRERLTRIVSRRSENIVKLFPLSFLSYTYRLS